MIGKKSLSQIRVSLNQACLQAGVDPSKWIGEELAKLDSQAATRPHEIETLELIRDGLRAGTSKGSRSRKNAKSKT